MRTESDQKGTAATGPGWATSLGRGAVLEGSTPSAVAPLLLSGTPQNPDFQYKSMRTEEARD